MKRCTGCHNELELSAFNRDRTKPDGRSCKCRDCLNALAGDYRPRQDRVRRTHKRVQKLYGITGAQFDTLLVTQEGRCASCSRVMAGERDACVDHCHETGEVRGLLCTNCNLLLGHAKDSLDILRAAQDYLLRSKNLLSCA